MVQRRQNLPATQQSTVAGQCRGADSGKDRRRFTRTNNASVSGKAAAASDSTSTADHQKAQVLPEQKQVLGQQDYQKQQDHPDQREDHTK